jgi:hypothetical protein
MNYILKEKKKSEVYIYTQNTSLEKKCQRPQVKAKASEGFKYSCLVMCPQKPSLCRYIL